jgi:hypothetical protein
MIKFKFPRRIEEVTLEKHKRELEHKFNLNRLRNTIKLKFKK